MTFGDHAPGERGHTPDLSVEKNRLRGRRGVAFGDDAPRGVVVEDGDSLRVVALEPLYKRLLRIVPALGLRCQV